MPEDTPTRREPNREEPNPEEPNSPDPSASPTRPDPTTEAPMEPPPTSRDGFFDTVLTPVANPTDARETARAVRTYLPPEATVYVAHVVQKGEGVPDKAGVEQRQAFAERVYEAFTEEFERSTASTTSIASITSTTPTASTDPDTASPPASSVRSESLGSSPSSGPSATPVTLYGRNVSRTILAGAHDVGATAVVFTPRGGRWWTKLLTGSVGENLLRDAEIPVVSLPRLRGRLVLD